MKILISTSNSTYLDYITSYLGGERNPNPNPKHISVYNMKGNDVGVFYYIDNSISFSYSLHNAIYTLKGVDYLFDFTEVFSTKLTDLGKIVYPVSFQQIDFVDSYNNFLRLLPISKNFITEYRYYSEYFRRMVNYGGFTGSETDIETVTKRSGQYEFVLDRHSYTAQHWAILDNFQYYPTAIVSTTPSDKCEKMSKGDFQKLLSRKLELI